MKTLSWMFFCLSPFALFCSGNGTGLILCPTFIILGFVCKWAANNRSNASKVVVKLEQKEFWKWHYYDRMRSTLANKDSICDESMAYKDKEARSWATTVCRYHNAWVPSDAAQEEIARSYGVITEQMIKENKVKKDRIQIGKYFLMSKLLLEYEDRNMRVRSRVREDMKKIKLSDHGGADDWFVKREYGKTVEEMWGSLTLEEKNEALEWAKEYEKRLIQAVRDYEEQIEFTVRPINMDF